MLNNKRRKNNDDFEGDLISIGSARFKTNFWKFLSSSSIDNHDCVLEVANYINEIVLVCWVKHDGSLAHYHPVNNGSIKDGSVKNIHHENTQTNHVFVCIKQSLNLPKHISDIDPTHFIFSYRPLRKDSTHTIKLKSNTGNNHIQVELDCSESIVDEVIDTSAKIYDTLIIHGFVILYEPILLTTMPELFTTIQLDLQTVCQLLPSSACRKLQKDTYFYINQTLTYGKKQTPIQGHEMCFHPSSGWLQANGCSIAKTGCIEIYEADHYLKGRHLWGVGGLLLHELCHAYHYKHCPSGYECVAVRDAYTQAMGEGLYDCVPVKGKQMKGVGVKAYACANCMEFFAELSVAYLFQESHFDDDDDDGESKKVESKYEEEVKMNTISSKSKKMNMMSNEYNKWYPHNAAQLRYHDPKSYAMLESLWHQQ